MLFEIVDCIEVEESALPWLKALPNCEAEDAARTLGRPEGCLILPAEDEGSRETIEAEESARCLGKPEGFALPFMEMRSEA